MGQLGTGSSGSSTTSPSVPVRDHKFLEVHAGGEFTCGRTQDLVVLCWGSNGSAQLGRPVHDTCKQGNRTVPCARTPVVVERTEFRLLSVGMNQACATKAQGETICWGGFKVAPGTLPKAVPGGKTFAMLAVGSAFACGLQNGDLFCWGSNFDGQLGNNTKQSSTEPAPVSSTLKFGSVRAGRSHACALTTSRQMLCWGDNLDGQLGDGTTTDSPVPVAVK
jgi:alpha-tubulin suppressor-like RCC1 family protein